MTKLRESSTSLPRLTWSGKQECDVANSIMPQVRLIPLEKSSEVKKKQRGKKETFESLKPGPHYVVVGDNLQGLEYLDATADLSFRFIYIDPPYNSGSKLTYNDSRSRRGNVDPVSTWLNFMYPRLKAAHRVLNEKGYIFISIDDRQYAELTLMMHEIFGRENHIGTIKWRKKRKASFLDQHFSTTMEYILVYAKNRAKAPKLMGEMSSEQTRPVLNASNQVSTRVLKKGTPAHCKDGTYARGVLKNRTLEYECLDDLIVVKGKLKKDVRVRGRFRVSQDVLDKSVFVTKNMGLRRNVADDEKSRKHATDDATAWPTNEDAENELRTLFKERVFTYPKPVGLIQNLLQMVDAKSKEPFYCLDFFAGSGTLAEAVVEANKFDGGNRRFFCIQNKEPLAQAVESSGLQTIADLTLARAQHATKQTKSAQLKAFELCPV